ncbi:MAG: glycosyltransferase family 2 protein [Candidatus Cloacimonetes bacterium]|nr:glycosyltransferase family 2 protein [Candidatus Cloacimonadota bacterium]
MLFWKILFWASVGACVYHIALYGFILKIITIFKKSINLKPLTHYPSVTVLCPAYNEEKCIEEKIQSFLNLEYPKDKIKMFVLSDDSSDRTNEIVSQYLDQNVELVIQKPRRGKQAAHNMILSKLDCDFVVSTDANTFFSPDAILVLLVIMQSDPHIGLVTGEHKYVSNNGNDSGEGVYWKFESALKALDSAFYSTIVANGSLFAIRKDLFVAVPPDCGDDFERTLYVLSKGYRAIHTSKAIVFEKVTEKATEEISRKIRIISQEWASLSRYSRLLNPFRHPAVSFMLISHKLIRLMLFFMAIGMFVSSGILYQQPFYLVVFIVQVLFYGFGTLGIYTQTRDIKIPYVRIVAYMVAMIWSSFQAYINFVLKKKSGVWNPIRK